MASNPSRRRATLALGSAIRPRASLKQDTVLHSSSAIERAITSLQNGISQASSELYKFQTALNNYHARRPIDWHLNQFNLFKLAFVDNLNTMMHFLQLCLGYANDYVSLCECSLRETIVDSGALLRELIATAKQNVVEVNILSAAYEKTNDIFRGGRFNSLFRRRFSLAVTPTEQFMYSSTDQRQIPAMEDSLPEFVAAAREAVNPKGIDALMASNSALQEIKESLMDFAIFWNDQVTELQSMINVHAAPLTVSTTARQQSLEKWERYKYTLHQVLSCVTASLDALAIDAPCLQQKAPNSVIRRIFWSWVGWLRLF